MNHLTEAHAMVIRMNNILRRANHHLTIMQLKHSPPRDISPLCELSLSDLDIKQIIHIRNHLIKTTIQHCGICLSYVALKDCTILNCSHRICDECFAQLINEPIGLRCPFCRKDINLVDVRFNNTQQRDSLQSRLTSLWDNMDPFQANFAQMQNITDVETNVLTAYMIHDIYTFCAFIMKAVTIMFMWWFFR